MDRRDVLRAVGSLLGGTIAAGGAATSAAGRKPSEGDRTDSNPQPSGGTADAFAPLGSLAVPGAREAVVGPDGTTVYVAVGDGFAIVDVGEPTAPRIVGERRELLADAAGGPLSGIQDVAVDGDRLLVVGPAHPDEEAVKAALLYDVSDPAAPRRLAVHRADYPIHNAALRSGRAYLTANDGQDNRLEVVEVGGEGAGSAVLGEWSPATVDEAWTDVPSSIVPLHDVRLRDDVAYCSYWDGGTWLVDVSDPSSPTAVGHAGERSAAELSAVEDPDLEYTELPGNHHSSAVDESGTLLAIGREAWDADGDGTGGPGGIDLFDVTDPGAPRHRSNIAPPPTPDPGRRGTWTTAHNFCLRDGVLYSAWYQGGVRVHDVSEPGSPRELAAWRDAEATRFWTAQRARAGLVASSMGTDAGDAGLYTFPLPEAEADPTETTTTPGAITATPGLDGFGVVTAVVAGGIAGLLARRLG